MVKDGEDWHGLQTMNLKSLAKLFKRDWAPLTTSHVLPQNLSSPRYKWFPESKLDAEVTLGARGFFLIWGNRTYMYAEVEGTRETLCNKLHVAYYHRWSTVDILLVTLHANETKDP